MDYIEGLLKNLNKIEPIPTGNKPNYYNDKSIKAVIFDIYGTLLVSSSGDIDQAEINVQNLQEALVSSNIKILNHSGYALEHILHDFEFTIRICHRESKKFQIPYPEIDILSIWEIVLLHARRKNLIEYNGDADIMQMTCIFEFLSNKVYPMPHMTSIINTLKNNGMPLGIVSNAQFYTPVLMNYFLNKKVSMSESIDNFDEELTILSYKLGLGKPDPRMFTELLPVLKNKYNLMPSQVLFVGNDMLKDIYASKLAGFKTALFAGDKRSLRMHEGDKRVDGLKPDHIITNLNQVLEIVN